MIALNYQKNAVLAMFFLLRHKIKPSPEDIQSFDKGLKSANEAMLRQHMTENGLNPDDLAVKSQILLYSQKAPGGSADDQIANACQFFINTQGF